jgi:DMSO/TMAO reductase YedYZ molybdopterin-dependent catalytic subunit
MSEISRRTVARGALAALAAYWARGSAAAVLADGSAPFDLLPDERLGSAKFSGLVPWSDLAPVRYGEIQGAGRTGRRLHDVSPLGPTSLITPNERFFIRTLRPDRMDPRQAWTLAWRLPGSPPRELSFAELAALAEPRGIHLLESVENGPQVGWGMISAATWKGVPITKLLERFGRPEDPAAMIQVEGSDAHSAPRADASAGAGWVFPLADLEAAGAFLATEMNGEALGPHHGGPVRLVVPGWYGCAWIKWVHSVLVLPEWAETTSQMREHAAATFQYGVPKRAKNYVPAYIEPAALPIRVERWVEKRQFVHRVVGLAWSGVALPQRLEMRFRPEEDWQPVAAYQPPSTNRTWYLWSHLWRPEEPGTYTLDVQLDGSRMRTRRISYDTYRRRVEIQRIAPRPRPEKA